MPQEIPLEASEVLAFTPASLESIEDAPVFRLRASSSRDKRFHRRLLVEHGIRFHDRDAIRAEVLAGLKALWDEEAFEEHSPVIKALWDARDEFDQQNADAFKKGEPELEWSYDADLENAVDDLVRKVTQEWNPLLRMIADNADYGSLAAPLLVAVNVKGFSNLNVKASLDRGYLTLDVAEKVEDALSKLERKHGLIEGTAWAELTVACSQRMYLTEEERGNSASQSPSTTAPAPLSETKTSEPDGKSPASARSKKTRSAE